MQNFKACQMRKLFVFALCYLAACASLAGVNAPPWEETTRFGFNTNNSKYPRAIFVNNYSPGTPAPNVWHQLDVVDMGLPPDVKWVALGGLLIITHGTIQQQCNLTLTTRAFGDTLDAGEYNAQAIEAHVGGGQRSTMFTIVPVRDGKFEWQWRGNMPDYTWPNYCSYGINLSIQAYGR